MKQAKKALILTATLLVVLPMVTVAEEDITIRVQRIEQALNNRQQFDTVNQLIKMQESVEQLTGQVDVQARTIKELENRQQMWFKDVDARLQALEKNSKSGSGPLMGPVSTPPAQASAPLASLSVSETSTEATATSSAGTVQPLGNTAAGAMQEQVIYQQAYQSLLDKNYSQATTGFNNYLTTYTQGRYRANAYYWLGEIYLVQNQPQEAQKAFNTVITEYPKNPKSSDALLKLGYAYAAMGDNTQAKTTLNQVIQKYPNTSAAALAQSRLAELN